MSEFGELIRQKVEENANKIEILTFNDLVEYGRKNTDNIVNGMPWSFTYKCSHISHENDECYIVANEKFTPNDLLIWNGKKIAIKSKQELAGAKITSENYVENAVRTDCVYDMALHARLVSCSRLLHAAIGIATEAGEFLDALKKHIYYGKPLDIVNCKEEASDLYWYLALAIDDMHTTMNDVMKLNIDKLRLRYPNKFSGEAAINRDVKAERVLLERVDPREECKALMKEGEVFSESEQLIINGTYSKKSADWLEFTPAMVAHIENYVVKQYGDKGDDPYSNYSVEDFMTQIEKYAKRYKNQSREGQEELDIKKIAHCAQMAFTKYQEEKKLAKQTLS